MGLWSWLSSLFSNKNVGKKEELKQMGHSKKGTRIESLQVLDVADGDTIRVEINGKSESLRLLSLDTEESHAGGSKPVTNAGKMATEMAKKYFTGANGDWCKVSIEFDTNESVEDCLSKHRGTYGRLLCYVYKDEELYNQKAIQEGWSPYFVKYGPSRLHDALFTRAQEEAMTAKLIIWDPKTNKGGAKRDYDDLLPWWSRRGKRVQHFREIKESKDILSIREDYSTIIDLMNKNKEVTLFCDLQGGITTRPATGAVLHIGGKLQPMSLWIPNANNGEGKALIKLIEDEYAHHGKGYCYITGTIESYKDKPQIILTKSSQLIDSL